MFNYLFDCYHYRRFCVTTHSVGSQKIIQSMSFKLHLLYNDSICSQNFMIMPGPLSKLITLTCVLI